MDRRISERYYRHLPVRVWRHGDGNELMGHTSNISHTGVYVTATRIFMSGTRVRLEVGDANSFWAEGIVVRSLRTPPELQRVKPAGMGIRFLGVTELVSELLQIPLPVESTPAAAGPDSPVAPAEPARCTESRTIEERIAPTEPVVSPRSQTTAAGPLPAPSKAVSASGGARFELKYPHREALATAIARDLSAGGMFVPTLEPASLDSIVVVEVTVALEPAGRVATTQIIARVVHRIEPGGPGPSMPGPNLMAGMGVQVLDLPVARAALEKLLQ